MTKRNQPGGGIGSRSMAKTTIYNSGRPSQRVNPGGADQLGQSMGNHTMGSGRTLANPATPMYGAAMPNKELGNSCAVGTVAKPGGSRTLYGQSGTNQQYGPVEGTVRPPGRSFDDKR